MGVVEITFESFETEKCCDYLDITDGNVQSRTFKGTWISPKLLSVTDRVSLHFVSDGSISRKGFSGNFVAKENPVVVTDTNTLTETTTLQPPATRTTSTTTTTTPQLPTTIRTTKPKTSTLSLKKT